MTELLTSAQMRAIEAAAIASGRVTGAALMERAGEGVVAAALDRLPALRARGGRAVVLCGPGNNGGDGYVIARRLRARGWRVELYALAPPAPAAPDAAEAARLWGGAVRPMAALTHAAVAGADLAFDAMFGTGLARPVAAGVWGALALLQEAGVPLVAVDIASGLCADTGRPRAALGYLDQPMALTVTFHRPKLGHLLAEGGALCGPLAVVDLGAEVGRALDALLRGPAAEEVADRVRLLPWRMEKGQGHKFTHGHAAVVAGGVGRGGAARLAARAALRVGAGLVTLMPPPAALVENAARLDAVMLRALADGAALTAALEDPRITALCLGPGLGTGAREAGLLAAALGRPDEDPAPGLTRGLPQGPRGPGSSPGRGLVLDADALTLLARHPDLMARLDARCVLTPHEGEFARLFPDLAEGAGAGDPPRGKVGRARAAAARTGAVVLLKGPDTVIAAPWGRVAVQGAWGAEGAPWLATAGAGDVLAGLIAGLLARGWPAFEAAEGAAALHLAAARAHGPGLIAEDLPDLVPRVLAAAGL